MGATLVVIVLIVLLVVAAGAGFAVALARRGQQQALANLETAPGMPTGAPREWAGAHTPEAKMHRRLVGLAKSLTAMPLGDAPAIERRVAVEQRINEIDQRLIALAPAPHTARLEAVAALEPEVVAVEAEVAAIAKEPPIDLV